MSFGLPDDFPFEVKRPLGHGSFASVFEGIDKKTNKRRAIKIVDLKKLQTKSHYAESEMRIMMRLQASKHPSLVHMYEAFKVDENSVALVLEYCDRGDLSSFVDQQEGKRVNEETAKKLMQDLALGLSFLRSKNIIHRDLKPQNLLLRNKRGGLVLKLADFGFAKELTDYNEVIPSLVGSPMYLAPELWKREAYTTKSDLWSVGVILYEIIFGHYLYFARSIPQLVQLVQTKDVEFPPDLVETISPECLDLIKGLLQKDPEKRLSWDKYLKHPWLDLATRELVDSFCDLKQKKVKPVVQHEMNGSDAKILEQKPQQNSDDLESLEAQEPKEPQAQIAHEISPKPIESPHISVAELTATLPADFDPSPEEEEEDTEASDPLRTAKALWRLAKQLEKGEPKRSILLYMEIAKAMPGLQPIMQTQPLERRKEAQTLFENARRMAETLSKAFPPDAKGFLTSYRVICGLAVELNQKAEIDELFSDFSMAAEEYSLACLLFEHLLDTNNLGPQGDRSALESCVERYEKANKRASRKAKEKQKEKEKEKEKE